MASKAQERAEAREEKLYEHLIAIADPVTGKVAISGPQAGQAIDCGAAAARLFLGKLVKDGKLIQISETKSGIPTLYRVPAFSKGDVRTTYTPVDTSSNKPYYSAERTLADREKRCQEGATKDISSNNPVQDIPYDWVEKKVVQHSENKNTKEYAKSVLKGQETLVSSILVGYLEMYRALENIVNGDI